MEQETRSGAGDDEFGEPYVDVDEWRDDPVRHRYVHGGFAGTETRFSIYLPPPEQYEGRFFQHITPVPDSENLAQGAVGEEDKIGFSIASGAYFLETNGGGTSGSPGSGGRSHHRRATGPTRRPRSTRGRRRRDVRRAPALRLRVRRQRRRVPHDRRRREHHRRVGRRPCPTSSGRRWPSRTCSPSACTPSGSCDDRSTRSSTPSSPAAAATCTTGLDEEERDALAEVDPDGVPAALVVRSPHDGHARLPGPLRRRAHGRPRLLRGLLDQPGYLGHERAALAPRDIVQHPCEVAATSPTGRRPSSASTWGRSRVRPAEESTPRGEERACPRPPRGRTSRTRRDRRSWAPSSIVSSGAAAGAGLGVLDGGG